MKPKRLKDLRLDVTKGRVLGVDVYRGYARLCDLAAISRADIYDQKNNPTGTQRDLSPKHAREAFEYVRNRTLAYWPEVFLCVRDSNGISFKPNRKQPGFGVLTLKSGYIRRAKHIVISRVDGNHRLYFADGHEQGFPPIEREVSFCLAFGLSLDNEITLFRDINDNQRRMNTSHLDNIQARLTPEQQLMQKTPALYIAQQLGRSSDSPLFGRVYEGGVKGAASNIPLRTLKTGIEYMLSRPTKLTALSDAAAQYKVIRNYFEAIKQWQLGAWERPRDFLLMRGAGLWGICFLGADVIDRTLSRGSFEIDDMLRVLRSGKEWDWSSEGPFAGLSGRGGAVKISERISAEFQDESGVSVKELYKKIMAQG
jgi:DGQHR domain-containing protein